jgi:aminoacylase
LFDKNNYEVALDEGLANEANFFTIFYGERTPYWFTVTAKGINNKIRKCWPWKSVY